MIKMAPTIQEPFFNVSCINGTYQTNIDGDVIAAPIRCGAEDITWGGLSVTFLLILLARYLL